MLAAGKKANELNHPVVFDSVGAGVSSESISSKINGKWIAVAVTAIALQEQFSCLFTI